MNSNHKQKSMGNEEGTCTPDILAVAAAMEKVRAERLLSSNPLWWNDPDINGVLSAGVAAGHLSRLSTTQVHWTESGIQALNAARAADRKLQVTAPSNSLRVTRVAYLVIEQADSHGFKVEGDAIRDAVDQFCKLYGIAATEAERVAACYEAERQWANKQAGDALKLPYGDNPRVGGHECNRDLPACCVGSSSDRKSPSLMFQAEKDAWATAHGIEFKREHGEQGGYLWRSTVNNTCWIGYHPSREAALDGAIECGGKFEGAVARKSAEDEAAFSGNQSEVKTVPQAGLLATQTALSDAMQTIDTLRHALEVIGVGNAQDPKSVAKEALEEAGFWEKEESEE